VYSSRAITSVSFGIATTIGQLTRVISRTGFFYLPKDITFKEKLENTKKKHRDAKKN